MSIRTVGVVGTGVIGASWTGLFLAHGLKVIVSDPAPGAERQLSDYLHSIWPTLEKQKRSPHAALTNYRFVGASIKDHFANVDFVQENAPERPELKTKLFAELDAATRPDVIIASSSSGIPSSHFISQCAVNPTRVLIGHPFNPPHLMPLVEVVPHPTTAASVTEAAKSFYKSLGRTPVHICQELPGFAANRLQIAVLNEAYSLVSRGIISAEDLDACVTNSLGPRWAATGPILSHTMGGGGGIDGFKHALEHFGPAYRVWLDDMKAHAFTWTPENLDALTASVSEELRGKDPKDLEQKRDDMLIKILSLRE
ncbi:L-carnitine dehydrogenase [Trichoderma asperellum]|uniref:L-carnitine dehydrogenase n=1 Tax=Trichoderma asperellum TaxID=101201 RepID=A0A6V8R6Y6_TRIAP|nr:L-carnitine dehydrogenase [Trichoderma asperellum]